MMFFCRENKSKQVGRASAPSTTAIASLSNPLHKRLINCWIGFEAGRELRLKKDTVSVILVSLVRAQTEFQTSLRLETDLILLQYYFNFVILYRNIIKAKQSYLKASYEVLQCESNSVCKSLLVTICLRHGHIGLTLNFYWRIRRAMLF